MSHKVLFVLFALVLSLVAINMAAQNQPAIHGRIVDAAGKPMAGMHLIARNASTGAETVSVANELGEYGFANLAAGVYLLQQQPAQSTDTTRTGVTVDAPKATPVDLQVAPSGNIQITAEARVASKSDSPVHQEYTAEPIAMLPQADKISPNGEFFGPYNLSLLTETSTPGSILQNGAGPALAGRPNTSNNFEINGTDNNNPAIGGPLVNISNDAVASFNIEQGEAAARTGHSTGGQANVIVTQGTNLWHGGVYDYLNNRKLNALEPVHTGFSRRVRYDQNRMGAMAGGPIIHNKLFTFVDFEYIPLRSNRTQLNPIFVPTALGFDRAALIPGVSANNLAALRDSAGVATSSLFNINVAGTAVPVGIANTSVHTHLDQFNGMANIDWIFGSTGKMSVRYAHNDSGTNADGVTLPQFEIPGHRRALLGQFNYTQATPSGVTFNYNSSYNRYDAKSGVADQTFPGLNAFPNISIQELGLNLGSPNYANRVRSNMYQAGGWAEYPVNGHQLRIGADVRYIETLYQNLSATAGTYAYSNLSRYLLDLAPDAGGLQIFNNSGYVSSRSIWEAFIQDRMRVHKVTLELGLAYQYAQLPLSVRRQSYLNALDVPGLIQFGAPHSDRNNFAPRLAWAWSPGPERTTLRGGFSMMYETQNIPGVLLGPELPVSTVVNPTSTTHGFLANGGLLPPVSPAAGVAVYTGAQSTPYIMEWNAGVTQALFANMTAEVKYVGNRGMHLPMTTLLNDPSGVSANHSLPFFLGNPGPATLNSLSLTQAQLAAGTNAFTLNGFTNPILSQSNDGTSWYNAAIIKLNDRFSGGTQISGQYTYSDARSDVTGLPFDLQFGRRMEQSIWARKHRATLTPVLDIGSISKNWSGRLRQAANSLTILATLTYESGARLPLSGGSGTGVFGMPQGSGVFVNPNGIAGTSTTAVPLLNSAGQIVAFTGADPNAQFIAGGPGTFSTEWPTLRLGQTRNMDVAVVKRFAVGHGARIEARADGYNIFNHPQFTGLPISTLGTGNTVEPGFLSVGNPQFNNIPGFVSGNPRTIQLALHLLF